MICAIKFNDGARVRYWAGGPYRDPRFTDHPVYTTVRADAEHDMTRLRMFNTAAGEFSLHPMSLGKGRSSNRYIDKPTNRPPAPQPNR
jgi:hypothetical protein